jgi:HK97 family phage major capsid protein
MSARVHELAARRDELKGQLTELLAAAAKDKRPLTAAETETADKLEGERVQVLATLKHEETRLDWERNSAPAIDPAAPAQAAPTRGKAQGANPWGDTSTKEGFSAALGAFLVAVANASRPGGTIDPRLLGAASGLNTAVGADAGFLVRTDFSTQLLNRAIEQSVLAQRCNTIEIGDGFDGIELPFIAETSRANGSRWGGVQVYRRAEAETVTATKPKLDMLELRLEDLMGICYATDRATRDAVSLGQIIQLAFSSEFAFKLDDEIYRGTGVGQCLGILTSPATVSQAAEAAQVADTVVAENIVKMRARLRARNRANSIWIINQEVEPQLPLMTVKVKNVAGAENVGGAPIYMPANGLSVDGYDTLFGRPLVPLEQASAVGDVGDIALVDMGEYLLIRKGGIQADQSMHVRFLYGENTYRFVQSVNGAPTWKSSLTPYKGANALSPFVTLAAR